MMSRLVKKAAVFGIAMASVTGCGHDARKEEARQKVEKTIVQVDSILEETQESLDRVQVIKSEVKVSNGVAESVDVTFFDLKRGVLSCTTKESFDPVAQEFCRGWTCISLEAEGKKLANSACYDASVIMKDGSHVDRKKVAKLKRALRQ